MVTCLIYKMPSVLVSCIIVLSFVIKLILCIDVKLEDRWQRFKIDQKKTYSNREESLRRGIWEAKIREIEEHNKDADRGLHSYWLKETPWDDLTYLEFMYNNTNFVENDNYDKDMSPLVDCKPPAELPDTLPDSVDWTQLGYVTSVKDQGRCGACWALSVAGTIEGQWFRKTRELVSLSPQSLLDCVTGNSGCKGGDPVAAYKYIMKHGMPSETDYPYKAKDEACRMSTVKATAQIIGYNGTKTDEGLLESLVNIGPISIGLTTGPKMMNYGRGVFDGCTGPRNHGVLVVGYGVHMGKKVWKIKNSYGRAWGMDGYFYVTRECSDACGLAEYASYPILDSLTYPNMEAIYSLGSGTKVSIVVVVATYIFNVVLMICM